MLELSRISERFEYNNNESICHQVINTVSEETGVHFTSKYDKIWSRELLTYKYNQIFSSSYINLFYEILARFNYLSIRDVSEIICLIGLSKVSYGELGDIDTFLKSPFIDDIIGNKQGAYEISSNRFGNFDFSLATAHLMKNRMVKKYLDTFKILGQCHTNTLFLSKIFPENYSITSLIPCCFDGSFYHSYSYNPETQLVYDLTRNIVLSKETFDRIFIPTELSVIPNENIIPLMQILGSSGVTYNPSWNSLILITLFRQYLDEVKDVSLQEKINRLVIK